MSGGSVPVSWVHFLGRTAAVLTITPWGARVLVEGTSGFTRRIGVEVSVADAGRVVRALDAGTRLMISGHRAGEWRRLRVDRLGRQVGAEVEIVAFDHLDLLGRWVLPSARVPAVVSALRRAAATASASASGSVSTSAGTGVGGECR